MPSHIHMSQPFPTEDAFRQACFAVLAKYADFAPQLDRQRAYLGWEWREHRTKVADEAAR